LIEKLRASEASFLTDIQILKERARAAESAKENGRLKDDPKMHVNSSIPRATSPFSDGFASMGLNTKDNKV
jgi:hypothetical protein